MKICQSWEREYFGGILPLIQDDGLFSFNFTLHTEAAWIFEIFSLWEFYFGQSTFQCLWLGKIVKNFPLVWLELSAIWQAGPGFNFHIYWKRLCVSSLLTFPPANRKPIQMRTLCTLCICKTHILKPIQTRISLSCLVSQLPSHLYNHWVFFQMGHFPT